MQLLGEPLNLLGMKSSRCSSIESLEDCLKGRGSALFRKAVGRESKPAWTNRIVKDFYDLDYTLPDPMAKFTSHLHKHQSRKQTRASSGISKQHQRRKDIALDNHSEAISARRKPKESAYLESCRHNPEKIQVRAFNSSRGESLGLCPYEYQNTIEGRIKNRQSHHISFDKNKVNRPVNENPIYYNRHQDIDLAHSRIAEKKKAISLHHSFASYTDRRTFEPRDELDKIFDTDNGLKIASPRQSPDAIRKFELVVERRDPKLNESVTLSYEHAPVAEKLKRRSISYSIANEQRETEFYPQIISDRRGCYR